MDSGKNMIERLIVAASESGQHPRRCLVMAMILLRGGSALYQHVIRDVIEWHDKFGDATYDILEYWAGGLGIESDIAEAAVDWRNRIEGEKKYESRG